MIGGLKYIFAPPSPEKKTVQTRQLEYSNHATSTTLRPSCLTQLSCGDDAVAVCVHQIEGDAQGVLVPLQIKKIIVNRNSPPELF